MLGFAHISDPNRANRTSPRTFLLFAVGFLVVQATVLLLMGQPLVCTCGSIKLWTGSVVSSETSQQFADWYSLTHLIHGFFLYLVLWCFAPNSSVGLRFAVAVGLEAGWEILENTPFIINRYRQLALAHGYTGDSVINSIGDTLAAGLGFAVAHVLPGWVSVACVVAIELLLAYMIHDTLTIQIIQLIHPIAAIARWQTGT